MCFRSSNVTGATKYQYILPKPSSMNKARKILADIKNVMPPSDQTGSSKPTPDSHPFEQHMESNAATKMLWNLSRQHQIDKGLRDFKSLDMLKEEDKGFLLFVITHGNQLATKMPHLSEPDAIKTFKMLWSKMTDEHKSWYHNNENVIQLASRHQHGHIQEAPHCAVLQLEKPISSNATNASQSNAAHPPIQFVDFGLAPQTTAYTQQSDILTNVRYAPNIDASTPGMTSSTAPFTNKLAVLPKVEYMCSSIAVSLKKGSTNIKHTSKSGLSKETEFEPNDDIVNEYVPLSRVTFAPNSAILPKVRYRPSTFKVSLEASSDGRGKPNKTHEVVHTADTDVPQALDLSKPDSCLVPKMRVSPSVSHLPNGETLPPRVFDNYTASSQREISQSIVNSHDGPKNIPWTNFAVKTYDKDVSKDENTHFNIVEPHQTSLSNVMINQRERFQNAGDVINGDGVSLIMPLPDGTRVPGNGCLPQDRYIKNSYVLLPPGSILRPACPPDSRNTYGASDGCRSDTEPLKLLRSDVLPQIRYVFNKDVPPNDVDSRPCIRVPNHMGDSHRDRHIDDSPLLKRPRKYIHQVKDPKVYQIPRPFKVDNSASSALLDTDHITGTSWTLSLDTKREPSVAPTHTDDHTCNGQFKPEIFFKRIYEDVNGVSERPPDHKETSPQLDEADYEKAETHVCAKKQIKTEDNNFDVGNVTMEVNDSADSIHRDSLEKLPIDTYTHAYELKQNSMHNDIDIKPAITSQYYDLDNSAEVKLEIPEIAIETDFSDSVDRNDTVIDDKDNTINQLDDGEEDVEYVMIPCDVNIAKLLGWPVHKLPRISKEHLDRYKDC